MRVFVLLVAAGIAGCAHRSPDLAREYLSQVHTRVIYTAANPLYGELEIRNLGARTINYAAPLFLFSAERDVVRCSLSSLAANSNALIFETHFVRPSGMARVQILPNNEHAKLVGAYFYVIDVLDNTVVIWSDNRQR